MNSGPGLALSPDGREDDDMKGTSKEHASTAAPAGSTFWKMALSWLSGLLILAAVVLVALHFTELQRRAHRKQH